MKNFARYALAATALAAVMPVAQANAATLVVNVAGGQGFAAFGGAGNTVRTYNVGAGSTITGVSYSVNITARGTSWLSEATLAFTNSLLSNGVFLSPGVGVDNAGTASYSGSADLVALGLSFAVGADGLLRLEYFDSFVDGELPDSIWNNGTVTFTYSPAASAVPEPATWAMMIGGFGMVGGALRSRRRKTTVSFA
ncbi:hypothetical protein ASG11_07050 [Sphingomonas sp. Leaf357]|uniref:PEPxxWA-CTERM sorting domain-containing protein n=1 Tax=Sphingomonas sp. Leaf357 TaxID=1736350 RepID=UPI00070162AE|nr:PEPxxWA-CTERM sorting domain-containing protein [Sphingomonas sp. Leaf357]KQS04035.1 hypothetical protein ASG11_07050 [Sphingomonas sp. Leaf357]